MLPRPVVTVIVVLLTLGELANLFGQIFLGSGDTAFHIAYPAVLGALGFTAKKSDPEPGESEDESADAGAPRLSRHRRESR